MGDFAELASLFDDGLLTVSSACRTHPAGRFHYYYREFGT
jgi:hypothetical protein